jgi:hypothetical protein
MGNFIDAAFGYPTVLLTALLGVVLFYWVLALVGLVDFEAGGWDVDLDVQADGSIDDIGTLAGYVVAFGLNGVPFSVVVSLLVLFSWLLCCMAGMWVLPLVPTALLRFAAGTGALVASLALALPATARTIRPLRGLFVTHTAIQNAALVGQLCRVVTGSVDRRVGRAEVAQRGASINIRVWANEPNALTRGSAARIVDYDAERARYLIVPEA